MRSAVCRRHPWHCVGICDAIAASATELGDTSPAALVDELGMRVIAADHVDDDSSPYAASAAALVVVQLYSAS